MASLTVQVIPIPSSLFLATLQKKKQAVKKTLILLQLYEKTHSSPYSNPSRCVHYETCLYIYHGKKDFLWVLVWNSSQNFNLNG